MAFSEDISNPLLMTTMATNYLWYFIPLLIAMGAADDSRTARMLHRSYVYGSLSYMCWQFG